MSEKLVKVGDLVNENNQIDNTPVLKMLFIKYFESTVFS